MRAIWSPGKINPSSKSGRAAALPAPPQPPSSAVPDVIAQLAGGVDGFQIRSFSLLSLSPRILEEKKSKEEEIQREERVQISQQNALASTAICNIMMHIAAC